MSSPRPEEGLAPSHESTPAARQARRARELFHLVLEVPEEEREQSLVRACAGDAALFEEVRGLLGWDAEERGLLGRPRAADAEAPDPLVGETLGAYRLVEILGEGGMGRVYRATRKGGESVAIKVLREHLAGEEHRGRFVVEREILSSLDHPSIARLEGGGTTPGGAPFLVIELVEGAPITEHCDRLALSLRQRVELLREVCDAVHFAHQNLVVHRDLKPSNVLIDAAGRPRVLDFGIAKILPQADESAAERSATLARIMTPNYASPEHISGGRITTASDVYSLGVLLYQLLCGRLPYDRAGRSLSELAGEIAREEAPTPSRAVMEDGTAGTVEESAAARATSPAGLRNALRGDLDAIVMRCLRPAPADRYHSVRELSEDLARYLDGRPVQARSASKRYLIGRFVRRHRIAVASAAAVFLLALAFAVGTALQARRTAAQRDQARLERSIAQRERDNAEAVTRLLEEAFLETDPYEGGAADRTARDILDRGAEIARTELEGSSPVRATLMTTLGRVYRGQGLYAESEEMLRSAFEMRREAAAGGAAVAESLRELAVLRGDQGSYAEAERFARQALAEQPATDDPVNAGRTLRLLADIVRRLGRADEAAGLAEEALELHRRHLGEEHEEVADDLYVLAISRIDGYDLPGASEAAEKALAMRRRIPTTNPLHLTRFINVLASCHWLSGRTDDAEALFREVVALRREQLEPDHPSLAAPLTNLANVLTLRGDHAEAEPLLREAVELLERALGPSHPDLARSLSMLGGSFTAQGRLGEAEEVIRRALAMQRELLGESHIYTLHTLDQLTEVLVDRGELTAALALQRRALELREETLAGEGLEVASSWLWIAVCLQALGRPGEAEPAFEGALAAAAHSVGEDHWFLSRIRIELAELYVATGRLELALPMAESAVERLLEARPAGHRGHWHAALGESILGWVRLRAGRTGGVEELLERSYETLRTLRGPAARVTRDAQRRLQEVVGSGRSVGTEQ